MLRLGKSAARSFRTSVRPFSSKVLPESADVVIIGNISCETIYTCDRDQDKYSEIK